MKKTVLLFSLLTVALTCSFALGGKKDNSPAQNEVPMQVDVQTEILQQADVAHVADVAAPLQGLRKNEITGPEDAPVDPNWKFSNNVIPRTFIHQPPVIPHDITGFTLNSTWNDCLLCHGVDGSGAPRPFKTHYLDREGKETESIAKRWHFCTQCHVGQVDAPPLVENVFGSGKGKYSLGTKK
ncbi:nitrate reductase cytochrome c-type subunit [Candidatus Electronema sp. JM]|uniref:nitrate reductase cytochrome c-type subunit n=1 Tax=Candidatus Electronema sp. JM TaxID=3401571 RepID=UPI003AA928A1